MGQVTFESLGQCIQIRGYLGIIIRRLIVAAQVLMIS
jgi:hypothetical protein